MARLSEHGIRLSSMSPVFLNSNSTSHTWPFSAVAELVDNSSDPGVSAKQIWMDVVKEGEQLCLTFTDNGNGMTPNKLHKMLSFGFTEKGSGKASQEAIGIYGNGFKSGSMRLGRDALILTKNGGCQSVGLLSQTYLENVKAQAVIVPIVPFNQQTKSLVVTEDSEASLAAILQHSIIHSLEQIHKHFDSIPSKKGTKILIWNLRRAKDGKLELDFDSDESDIRLPEIQIEELKKGSRNNGSVRSEYNIADMHYSLRAYLSILYIRPRTQVVLRGKKIQAKMVSKWLVNMQHDVYKPHFTKEKMKVTFGLNPDNEEQCGIMMYHKNRLIKAYEKVGCQLKTSGQRAGIGVIGIIECNVLKPAHNKQDFEYTKEYRLTLGALGVKLNDYWREVTEKQAREREIEASQRDDTEDKQDEAPMWLQCAECMKWRSVPSGHYKVTPENWNCSQNPNRRYRSCSSPEETGDSEEQLTPSYRKNHKKVERHKSIKHSESAEVHSAQKQAGKFQGNLRSSDGDQLSFHSTGEPTENRHGANEKTPNRDETNSNDLPEHGKNDDENTNDDKSTQKVTGMAFTREKLKVGRDVTTKYKDDVTPHQTEKQAEEGEKKEPNHLSSKRKSASSFDCPVKKRHLLRKHQQDSENQAKTLQKQMNTSLKMSSDEDETDSSCENSDAPHQPHISHSWSPSQQSTQTRTVAPLSGTEGPQLPPEGADREAKIQRLAFLEKETLNLRSLLGLEIKMNCQNTVTTADSSTETQGAAGASSRDVGSQTDPAEVSTFQGSALAVGTPVVGQRALYESKAQLWQNLPRQEKTEGQSGLRDGRNRSYEDNRSTLESLQDIRNNLVLLLTALLPQLDLTGISLETRDVDNILQQIVEVNSLKH